MELVNIFIQLFLFTIFSFIGCSIFLLKSSKNNSVYFFEHIFFNIILQINLILFLSFFNISLDLIFLIYSLYLILSLFFLIKEKILIVLSLKIEIYLLSLFLFVCLVFFVDIANSPSLEWDAEKFWIYKTLNFYNNGTIESLNNLPAGDGANYPYLGSLLWSFFWKLSLIHDEYSGRLFFVFLYTLSIYFIVQKLNISLIYKMLFFIILVSLSYDHRYFGGEQDILIFILTTFLAITIYDIHKQIKSKVSYPQIILLILVCNLLIWTKDEGLFYSFISIFVVSFFSNIEFKKKLFLISSVIFLTLLKLYIYNFYHLNIGINELGWNNLSVNSFFTKFTIERIFTIFEYFLYGFFKNYYLIIGLIFFLFSLYTKDLIKKNIYIYIIILLNYGFIFGAYITTDIDLTFMLKTGIDRLLLGSSPLYLLIFIEYFNSKKFRD